MSRIFFGALTMILSGCADFEIESLFECDSPHCQKCFSEKKAERLSVDGYWLMRDKDNEPQTVVAVYKNSDVRFIKMLAIFHDGKMDDTILKPIEKSKGISGNPSLCGLDFVWNLKESGDEYVGKVVNPDDAKVYRCRLWYDSKKSKLVMRGELFVFGENEYLEVFDISKLSFKVSQEMLKPNTPKLD